MVEWFKTHVFIAAWASPVIALVAMILKKPSGTQPLNWSRMVIYVAFLTALAALLTPGLDGIARGAMFGLIMIGFGWLMTDAGSRR
jgi:hypothetical protein